MLILGLAAAAATSGMMAQCVTPAGWDRPLPARAALTREMHFALQPNKSYQLSLAPARSVRMVGPSRHAPKASGHQPWRQQFPGFVEKVRLRQQFAAGETHQQHGHVAVLA